MPAAGTVILVLKFLVAAVTLLLAIGLVALARGHQRLHGRINLVFFILTMATVAAFEGLLQLGPRVEPGWEVTRGWSNFERLALMVHLCFVIPLTLVMPVMLFTGWRHYRRIHVPLAIVFAVLWSGMFVTGMFFLPHDVRSVASDGAATSSGSAPGMIGD